MVLGEVLEQLRDEAFAAEMLLSLDDLPLVANVETTAQRFGENAATYAAGAAGRFAAFASDEDWLALMNALERAGDPGTTCLRQMLTWSLRHDTDCKGSCS